jgi:hypothetical protein
VSCQAAAAGKPPIPSKPFPVATFDAIGVGSRALPQALRTGKSNEKESRFSISLMAA